MKQFLRDLFGPTLVVLAVMLFLVMAWMVSGLLLAGAVIVGPFYAFRQWRAKRRVVRELVHLMTENRKKPGADSVAFDFTQPPVVPFAYAERIAPHEFKHEYDVRD